MKTVRKIYDMPFKEKTVELSNKRFNIKELAIELGIRVTLRYKCRKKLHFVVVNVGK